MIKMSLKFHLLLISLTALSVLATGPALLAQESDFSCMKDSVRNKTQVSRNYREYDIVLENQCSEPVYWSMCIERMNPWTNEIKETLTPSARVGSDKKFRINLQMKRQVEDTREDFEEFYVYLAYDLHSPPSVECVAYSCETKKRALRAKYRENEKALAKIRGSMAGQISKECVRTGWSDQEKQNCQARVSKDFRPSLSELGVIEISLKEQLAAIEPERCRIHPLE
jgi:hypothetical protein